VPDQVRVEERRLRHTLARQPSLRDEETLKRATPALKRRAIFVAPLRGGPAGDAKKIPGEFQADFWKF